MIFIAIGARALLGVVFLIALVSKVRSRKAFKDFSASLVGLTWIPVPLRRSVAWAIVAAEAIVVVLVALPPVAWAGLLWAGLVLLAFSGATYWAMRSGATVQCHCFGASASALGPTQLVRDLVLVAIALGGLAASSASAASASAPALALAAGTGALVGAALTRWDDLAYLFGSTHPRGSA